MERTVLLPRYPRYLIQKFDYQNPQAVQKKGEDGMKRKSKSTMPEKEIYFRINRAEKHIDVNNCHPIWNRLLLKRGWKPMRRIT